MFQELIVSEGSVPAAQSVAADIWHFSRTLGHPYSQPDQVFWSFVADDDNGLLEDGTPHHAAICVGASNHGFDCPEVQLVILRHDGTESTDTPGDVTIAAESVGISSPVDEVRLFYKKNNEIVFTEVALGNVGGDDYEGAIPGLTVPTEVFYYLESEDQLGNIQRLPASAPDVFAFDVATIFDQAETDPGWTVNPDATDDATTGQWNRMDPQGTAAQPEDDYSVTGTNCWVTNGVAGAQLGTNDVDGGTTTLQSPAYNVTGSLAIAKVKYYRWYSNDQGAAPGSDTWVVQARNNGGAWTTVESTIQSSNAWVQHTVNLLAQFGTVGVVEFRFLASDLGSGSIVEAAVDDLTVLADLGGIVDVEIEPTDGGVPAVTYLAGARPNPFNPRTSIQYGLDASSDVRLEVFDVTGRLVTTLVNTNQTAGNYSVVWDGRDASGVSASSGVYYTRLTTNRAVKQQKLTLVR